MVLGKNHHGFELKSSCFWVKIIMLLGKNHRAFWLKSWGRKKPVICRCSHDFWVKSSCFSVKIIMLLGKNHHAFRLKSSCFSSEIIVLFGLSHHAFMLFVFVLFGLCSCVIYYNNLNLDLKKHYKMVLKKYFLYIYILI